MIMEKIIADLVVYGKIFTSEGNQLVEAFAVKDGKYVYVGDKEGAEAFILPMTKATRDWPIPCAWSMPAS